MELYGKDESQFETILEFFLSIIGKYEAEDVFMAMGRYVRQRSRFPTPADIVGIIEERVKRDPSYYNTIREKLKKGQNLTAEQSYYLKEYERQALNDWE